MSDLDMLEGIFHLTPLDARRRWKSLTPRQADVAARLAQDRTNQEVAHELGISIKTIDDHLMQIKTKLQVRTMAGIATIYYAMQLADLARSVPNGTLQETVDLLRGMAATGR